MLWRREELFKGYKDNTIKFLFVMRLIMDNREHDLIEKCGLILTNQPNLTRIETAVLPIGDILMKTDEGKDVLLVERKTLADLLASIKDGRYEEQSHRLKHASGFDSHNVIYLIEGMFSTLRTPLEKKLILSAITSLMYFKGFSVYRTASLQETAEFLIYMADKIDRNFVKGVLPWYLSSKNEPEQSDTTEVGTLGPSYAGFVKKVKKDNITPENMGEILLCQIPGISSQYAQVILNHFGGFSTLLTKIKEGGSASEFENITYETKGKKRRIPKNCFEDISKYFEKI
jgi:ERCC4-type nuclease